MGRYDERYTEEQRQAVGRAMLDPDPITGRKVTAREAVDRLMDGRLGVPAPPERMPHTTAYVFRNRERNRQQGHELSPEAKKALEDPTAVKDRLNQRILSIHERNIDKLEAQLRRPSGSVDPRLFSLVVKNHREIMAAIRPPGRPIKVMSKNQEPKPADAPDVVAELRKAHEATRRGVAA
jgi:hypothetical protein